MPKFSIITPVHLANDPNDRSDRLEKFQDCIVSVANQTFRDFEWIVVDDGSTTNFDWDLVLYNPDIPQVNLVTKEHGERVIAYNRGLEVARGEWICFLDSDDEYSPKYLDRVNYFIIKNPKVKLFNYGATYSHPDGKFTFRGAFKPKRKHIGHEVFSGGNVVNGTFVLHRSIYEDLGGYPGDSKGMIYDIDCTEINYGVNQPRNLYMGTPYDFSAAAQLEFPEIRQYFMVNHVNEPNKIIKELGNPWGNDYYLFYKYTRKYHSRAVEECLYIVNQSK